MSRFSVLLIFFLLFPSLSYGEKRANVVRDAGLMSQPSSSATQIMSLTKNSQVQILERKGGWYRVSTDSGEEGWLKLIVVRYEAVGTTRSSPGVLSRLAGSTGTTGIRGMDEEQAMEARGGKANLSQLKRFAASPEEASTFARDRYLIQRKVEYYVP